MNLRPYQHVAVSSALAALQENSSTLIVMPTGCGKTVVFSHIINQWTDRRVLVLAHREELIRQAADKIERITGEACEIEMADERADMHMYRRAKVIVSSIQTQIAGNPPRMRRFNPNEFGLVIIDEAHHAPADSYGRTLGYYANAKKLGVTATPDRADEVALGKVFDSVASVYEITDAIRDGYLVPIEQHSVTVTGLDYSGCKTTAGDLNQADVARVQQDEATLQGFVNDIRARAGNRKTIVFATPGSSKGDDPFKISERMTEIFNRGKQGCARRVSQDTPRDERRAMLRDYTDGKFQYLVNVGVLTEGFDEPGIEVVAITRPTKSRALYSQMIGRGTRPLPGLVDGIPFADSRRQAIARSPKPKLEVLDFEGNAGTHKLVHVADVLGGNYEETVVARATQKSKSGGSVLDHLEEARIEIEEERRRVILARTKSVSEIVDPFDVFDIRPPVARGWDSGGVTDNQRAMLEDNGVRVHENMTKAQAGAIISEIKQRRAAGLVGFRQAAKLRAAGLPTDITPAEAMNHLARARGVAVRS